MPITSYILLYRITSYPLYRHLIIAYIKNYKSPVVLERYLALNRLGRVVPISYIIMPLFNCIVLSLAVFTLTSSSK